MDDRVEKIIKNHLSEFDHFEKVDTDLMWNDFERRRSGNRQEKKYLFAINKWYAIAASIALVVGCALFFQFQEEDHKYLIVNNLEEFDQGLAQYQETLVSSMDSYMAVMKSLNLDLKDYPDIAESLDQVERLAMSYQNDLNQYGPDPKIIKAILKCTKQKVKLYEMLLYQVELKSYHEKKNEKFKI